MTNPWNQVTTEKLVKALEKFHDPLYFYQDHMQGGAASEVRLIRRVLIDRKALPEKFKTMPPHWFKGQKQS